MSETNLIEHRSRVRAAQKKVNELEASQQVHEESARRIEAELRSLGIDPDVDLDEQLAENETAAADLITRIEQSLSKLGGL